MTRWETQFDRRRLLGVAAAASLGIAGCSRGGGSGGGGGGGSKKSLTFLLFGATPQLQQAMTGTLIPRFKHETGIDVVLQTSAWGTGFQKVLTAAASHTLPDVLTVGGVWTAPLVEKGALLPLDQYTAGWSDRDQFYPSMWKDGQYKGKTYAIPVYADVRTVAYRADLLEKAGLDPDRPPSTWDEYRSYAQRLVQRRGSDVTVEGADWGIDTSIGLQQAFAQLVLQAGGTYYRSDGKADFSSAQGRKALEYLVSFYRSGLSSVNVVTPATGAAPLVSGQTAMTFMNMSLLANARLNNKDVVSRIKAGPPLRSDSAAAPTTSAWINKFGLSATTKNPEAGWRWLEFLSRPANLVVLDEQFGLLPPRRDMAHAGYLRDVAPDFVSAADHVVTQPPNPQMLAIAQVINTQLQRAIRRQASPTDVLRSIDKSVDGLTGA